MMKTTLNPDALAVLAPFKLSASAEALLEAVRNAWIIKHYEPLWGGVAKIEITAVPDMNRPILKAKVTGKNGGEIEPYFYVRNEGVKLTLTEYDEPNVMRCSNNPAVRGKAGPVC